MTWYEVIGEGDEDEDRALWSGPGSGSGSGQPNNSGNNSHGLMAAHFVRWWKTKIRNSYKQFSVLAEGERTDTEELVGRAASQCSAPPDLLPSEARALLTTDLPTTTTTTSAISPSSDVPKPASAVHTDTLHFEEFTCDVQVKGGEPAGGVQPLHFSFTLYDFDGHGRITKDDIAGIVSTIYESVGKTVTVPHYGSKTIQVRLTVSPDQRKAANGESESLPTISDHKVRFKRDLSNHVREGRRKPRRKRPECLLTSTPLLGNRLFPETEKPVDTVDAAEDERRSRLSIDDDVSDCSDRLHIPRNLKKNMKLRQYQINNLSPRYRNKQNNNISHHKNDIWNSQKENLIPDAQLCFSSPEQSGGFLPIDSEKLKGIADKKRSSSLQRKELLEIIQANMEKNHLSFQASRKQYTDQRIINSHEVDSLNGKNQRRHRSHTFTSKHALEPNNQSLYGDNPNNGYLDLANANVNPHKESNLCRYDSFLHAVICSSSQHAKTGYHLKSPQPTLASQQKLWKNHHRSRSHDLEQGPFRYTLLEPYENTTDGQDIQKIAADATTRIKVLDNTREQEILHRMNHTKNKLNRTESKTKSYEIEHSADGTKKVTGNRKTSAFHSHLCSPHHLKHQNREKYHARAMAQVEKWLENDNNTRLKTSKKKWADQECRTDKVDNLTANLDLNDSAEWKGLLRSSEAEGEGAESGGGSTVHRYVHEHIHHHYHHFEDKIPPSTNAVVV